jgi:hypothetical protein
MENFYYSALYDVLQEGSNSGEKALSLKRIQASIVRLNGTYYRSMWVDNGEQDRYGHEEPSLHHLIKEWKRKIKRTVHTIHDENGTLLTSSRDILRVIVDHFKRKYDTIEVNGNCMKRIMECNMSTVPDAANLALEEPIMLEEIYHAIKTGKPHKAPRYDRICLVFLKKTMGNHQRRSPANSK